MMVVININLVPLKIIRRKACLWFKSISRLSKDFGPKRCPKHLKERRINRNEGLYEGGRARGVHCKRYEGCYMK